MINQIVDYLDKLFPNPRCELIYTKDYELLMAVMLSAQTTDKRVNMVTSVLFEKYPTLSALAEAKYEDVVDIIRPVGTFQRKGANIIAIANALLKDCDGKVPNDRTYLEALPGVGRKTTNVVLANLFDEDCMAVDTHVARVSKRLGLAAVNDDVLKIEKKLTKKIPKNRLGRSHHQLVLFGRYFCKAKAPFCEICELKGICKFYQKNQKALKNKAKIR